MEPIDWTECMPVVDRLLCMVPCMPFCMPCCIPGMDVYLWKDEDGMNGYCQHASCPLSNTRTLIKVCSSMRTRSGPTIQDESMLAIWLI